MNQLVPATSPSARRKVPVTARTRFETKRKNDRTTGIIIGAVVLALFVLGGIAFLPPAETITIGPGHALVDYMDFHTQSRQQRELRAVNIAEATGRTIEQVNGGISHPIAVAVARAIIQSPNGTNQTRLRVVVHAGDVFRRDAGVFGHWHFTPAPNVHNGRLP